jgi:glycosyltransferase involved in cell wall biosynthesis
MSNKEKNLITILLPINSDRFLAQTLESINEQSLSSDQFNLIAVLDGSVQKVGIQQLLRSHLTKTSYKVVTTPKSGIVEALNTGLKYSNAEFIARIDQDDVMSSNRLQIQLRYLQDNPEVLGVGGQLELIDEDGAHIGFSYFPKSQWLISKTICLTSPMAHPSVMFRRAEVMALGAYRNHLPEDWDLWLRLHEAGKISNVGNVLVKYRIHPSQLSRTKLYQAETARQLVSISRTLRANGDVDHPQVNDTTERWIHEHGELLRSRTNQDAIKMTLWILVRKLKSLLLLSKVSDWGRKSEQ